MADSTNPTRSDGGNEAVPNEAVGGTETATDERAVGDILGAERSKRFLKYNVGMFLAVAIGYGVALFLLDAFVSDDAGATAGEFIFIGLVLGILAAPLIAAITGTITGVKFVDTEKAVGIVGGVGAFAGFLAMLVVMIIVASIVGDGSGGASEIVTDELLGFIGFAIGVGVTGGLAAYLTKQLDL